MNRCFGNIDIDDASLGNVKVDDLHLAIFLTIFNFYFPPNRSPDDWNPDNWSSTVLKNYLPKSWSKFKGLILK